MQVINDKNIECSDSKSSMLFPKLMTKELNEDLYNEYSLNSSVLSDTFKLDSMIEKLLIRDLIFEEEVKQDLVSIQLFVFLLSTELLFILVVSSFL